MFRDLRSLFLQVADLTPTERTTWFDRHGVTPEVRGEVESLLQFDQAAGQPLTECIAATARQFLGGEPVAGSRCGSFELVRLLGRGGMGAVFLAERHDGEVRQRAAIKFVRNMAPQELFLRERQVLAGLNHPGIARLLDAGHTVEGQPYMVMEYVEGEPVDVYCRNLDLSRKLELFLKIADALAYAHRNLIIHRDLKPSNILVDAAGQPKLLDFGIARMLDESADAGMTTERILTPEYASPEQVRGSAHTTATDIYSLGAVLYQLLTGRSPHAVPPGSDATMEEMVCRKDPAAPSSLNRTLPRDLDYIVAKALRKEPEERYAAIDAMADDIRALLESRPVRARAGNTWYRARKYLRRHWLPVSAAAIILLLLAAGMLEVNRERAAAQHRFQQLQQLANQVLTFDGEVLQLPGATKARQRIVSVSMAYLDGLGKEARGDPVLARDLANGYLQLAKVQGVPSFPNLGQLPEAEASLAKAESSIQTALRPDAGEPYLVAISAQIALLRMMVADTRKNDQTLTFAAQCAARLESLTRGGRAPNALLGEVSTHWINLANGYLNQHHFEEAVRYGRRGVEFGRKYGALTMTQAAGLSLVANALRQSGDLDGALAAITESRQMIEAAPSPNDVHKLSTLYSVLWRQGQILGAEASVSLGRSDDALPPLQRAFDLMDDLASKDPNDSLSRDRMGSAALQLGDVLCRRDPGTRADGLRPRYPASARDPEVGARAPYGGAAAGALVVRTDRSASPARGRRTLGGSLEASPGHQGLSGRQDRRRHRGCRRPAGAGPSAIGKRRHRALSGHRPQSVGRYRGGATASRGRPH